jgi:hypothetical protein
MRTAGRSVMEERLLPVLLADLLRGPTAEDSAIVEPP